MASLAHLIPRYSKNFFAHNRRNISSPLSFRTKTWNNEQLSCGSMTSCWKQCQGHLLSNRSLSLTRTVQCEEVVGRKKNPQKPTRRDPLQEDNENSEIAQIKPPPPPKVIDPKITALVEQLLLLNIMEQLDFIEVFADKIGVTPEQMKAALQPQVVYTGAPAGSAAPVAEAAPAEAPVEKPAPQKEEEEKESSYTIKLTKLAEGAKFKVLKEIRSLGQLNEKITESRRFVENLPQVIKYNASKEELEAWREKITAAGGTIETETT